MPPLRPDARIARAGAGKGHSELGAMAVSPIFEITRGGGEIPLAPGDVQLRVGHVGADADAASLGNAHANGELSPEIEAVAIGSSGSAGGDAFSAVAAEVESGSPG